ncbi:MAG: glucose-6-phosphate isomerase, partial [Firmicutes bacterium]|nr:glucose-6-phosphate isomerase [Bacillota bacterium]
MSNIKLDYNNMMQEAIGKHGFTKEQIAKEKETMAKALETVLNNRGKGWQEWTELPYQNEKDLDDLITYCNGVRAKADSFVILGIGGSALGPLSVLNALLHLRHNELSKKQRNAPKYYVEDNIDPERMRALLDCIDLKTAYFNVITKSGETSETLAQFLILYDLLKKKLGVKLAKERIIVTTTIGKGRLFEIANAEGFKIFGVGEGVGGRFSVFSSVGLVPLAVCGVDIKAMLKGAVNMAASCMESEYSKNPALLSAFLQVKSMENGKNISIMMPYADSLKFMADFYGQLWGESLGKAVNNNGKYVFVGQTPAKALGVTDQHSQIQLYVEGPFDKVVTFIAVDKFRKTEVIADDSTITGCCFLKGQTLNDLLNFERVAT